MYIYSGIYAIYSGIYIGIYAICYKMSWVERDPKSSSSKPFHGQACLPLDQVALGPIQQHSASYNLFSNNLGVELKPLLFLQAECHKNHLPAWNREQHSCGICFLYQNLFQNARQLSEGELLTVLFSWILLIFMGRQLFFSL